MKPIPDSNIQIKTEKSKQNASISMFIYSLSAS